MKNILIIFLALVSCKTETSNEGEITTEVPYFGWLVGDWQRINDEPGKKTFEHWLPTHAGQYLGHGFTLQGKDTIFEERLSIKSTSKSDSQDFNNWVLQVSGVNEQPTIFELEEYTDDSFTAVNMSNEFPTHITYSIANDTLKAQVSNEEFSIAFDFVKK